jgi:hypothetical protein
LPDFRNLLYRDLNLISEKNKKGRFGFYSSDAIGNYKVVINGKDKNGVVFYGEKIITVN